MPTPLTLVPKTPLALVPVPVVVPETAVPFAPPQKPVIPVPFVELPLTPVPLVEVPLTPVPLPVPAVALPLTAVPVAEATPRTPLPVPSVNPLTAVPEPVATLVIEVPAAELVSPVAEVWLLVILKQPLAPFTVVHAVLLTSGVVIAKTGCSQNNAPAQIEVQIARMCDVFIERPSFRRALGSRRGRHPPL
jgi:hypothetical protein